MATDNGRVILDTAAGITNAADDEELYAEILEMYLEDAPGDEASMLEYLDAGDLENYEIIVHALKNNFRTFGAMDAGELAYGQELAAKRGDAEAVRAGHGALLEEAALVRREIESYLGK